MIPGQSSEIDMTQDQIDIIGEVSNISMGSAATALSNIMGKKVMITSPQVSFGSTELMKNIERIPSIGVVISYTEGIVGQDVLIIRKQDAIEIVKVLMGEDVSEDEFNEIHISAISEVMNQMMGSSATALSTFIGKSVNISPPSAFELTEENKDEKLNDIYSTIDKMVMVRFLFDVEDVLQSEIYTIMGAEFAQQLVEAMMNYMQPGASAKQETQTPPPAPQRPAPEPVASEPQGGSGTKSLSQSEIDRLTAAAFARPQVSEPPVYEEPLIQPQPVYQQPVYQPPIQQPAPVRQAVAQTSVRPVMLKSFDDPEPPMPMVNSNFGLIQDVPLELAVEVGRARKLVKEVLEMTVGAIIELDKQAGDPVDVIVNGQLIAKGEVVVIDENFGVRITDIIGKK